MKEDIQKTALRLPRDLHTAILDAAKVSGRTMNAEIVHRLQLSFEAEQRPAIIMPDEAHRTSHSEYAELREKFDEMLTKMDKLLAKTDGD